jgi:hypothetical protein
MAFERFVGTLFPHLAKRKDTALRLPSEQPGTYFVNAFTAHLTAHLEEMRISPKKDLYPPDLVSEDGLTHMSQLHRLWLLPIALPPEKYEILFSAARHTHPSEDVTTHALYMQSAFMKNLGQAYLIVADVRGSGRSEETLYGIQDDPGGDKIIVQALRGAEAKPCLQFLDSIYRHEKKLVAIDPPPPPGGDDYMARIKVLQLANVIRSRVNGGPATLRKDTLYR